MVMFLTLLSQVALGQTDLKVGAVPGAITPSAVFEAASTNKGLLIPRMTTAQMNAISSPANGLLVYNTTFGCVYVYQNTAWVSTCSASYVAAWGLTGNTGTTAGTNFIGTTDAQALVFKTNNIEWARLLTNGNLGINTSTPQYKLDIDARTGGLGNPMRLLGLNAGTTSDSVLTSSSGIVRRLSIDEILLGAWRTTGNGGTNAATHFLGTTDAQNMVIKANNKTRITARPTDDFAVLIDNYPTVASSATTLVGTLNYRTANVQAQNNSRAQFNSVVLGTAGSTGTVYGLLNQIDAQAAGIYGNLVGINSKLMLNNTGTATSLTHYLAEGVLTNAYAATNVYGFRSDYSGSYNTTNISNLFGVHLTSPASVGNYTGIHIGNIPSSAGTRYAWHYNHTTNPSVINGDGNMGIGTVSPQYKLDIDAQTASSGNPLRLRGLNVGTASDSILTASAGVVRQIPVSTMITRFRDDFWGKEGNGGTNSSINFAGTTDNNAFVLRTNNVERARITEGGNLGVNTAAPNSSLQVNGSFSTAITTRTTAYTATATDHIIIGNAATGAFNVTLPTAVGIAGRQYIIKKTDASTNAVTVATTGGQTIDGATTVTISIQWQSKTVVSDGANWLIISNQ